MLKIDANLLIILASPRGFEPKESILTNLLIINNIFSAHGINFLRKRTT